MKAGTRPGRRRTLGASLIELMVAIGITSIVVVGAFMVMNEGLQLYRTNKRAADVQIDVLQILTRVTTEAVNAKADLIRAYPESGPGIPGLVFASPLKDDGSVDTDDVTGEVYWQKWICYYFVQGDPAAGTLGKLYRSEFPIEPSTPGSKDLTLVKNGLDTYNTNYFRDTTALQRRLLGGDVSGFEVKKYEGDITNQGATGTTTAHNAYDITVQAGDKTNRSSTGYFIKIDSRVTPRG